MPAVEAALYDIRHLMPAPAETLDQALAQKLSIRLKKSSSLPEAYQAAMPKIHDFGFAEEM